MVVLVNDITLGVFRKRQSPFRDERACRGCHPRTSVLRANGAPLRSSKHHRARPKGGHSNFIKPSEGLQARNGTSAAPVLRQDRITFNVDMKVTGQLRNTDKAPFHVARLGRLLLSSGRPGVLLARSLFGPCAHRLSNSIMRPLLERPNAQNILQTPPCDSSHSSSAIMLICNTLLLDFFD